MQLARVRGNVVASIKASGLASHKLLLLEPVAAADPLSSGDDEQTRSRDLYV
ncbi:EutN/CcmL family microcompartment protein, partial [Roseateles sp. GG27B]